MYRTIFTSLLASPRVVDGMLTFLLSAVQASDGYGELTTDPARPLWRRSQELSSIRSPCHQTAWVKPGTKPTIGIIRDFVSPAFTNFLALLVDEYSTIGYTNTECGYACSDHVRLYRSLVANPISKQRIS